VQTNIQGRDSQQETVSSAYLVAVVAALGLAVCCLAIDNQSYWADEVAAVTMAKQPTLALWWVYVSHRGADVLMPLYLLFAWAWEKVVGHSEFAMRAGNLLWFLPGSTAVFYALAGKPLLRWSFLIVLLSCPFAWYYLNEARPYAMQIALSLVVFAALFQVGSNQQDRKQERVWVTILCLGSLLLAAVTMLAMLWLAAYLGAAIASAPQDHRRRLLRAYRVHWVVTLTLLFILGLYYLRMLGGGARGTSGSTDIRNVAFVAYELFGFSGLGPGRLEINNGGLSVFRPWLPWLAVYGVVLLIVLTQGWRQIATFTSGRTRICWIVALVSAAGLVLAAGAAFRWRTVGRHCISMVVPILFMVGAGVARLLSRKNWTGEIVATAFVGLSLVSDMNLRFSQRHAKEDCRTAAAIALAAANRGERVWWCADQASGYYYGAKPYTNSAPGYVWLVKNLGEHGLRGQPLPELVVLSSKLGAWDQGNQVRAFLEHNHYHLVRVLPGFTIWSV